MRNSVFSYLRLSPWLAAAVLLTGCPKAKGPEPETPATETAAPAATETAAPAVPTLSVGTDWAGAPGFLDPVYFEGMRAELSENARAALKKNALVLKAVLKASPGVKIRVEGHCDERGTLEYNLALGQSRANALQTYYASLGIPRALLSGISYGEERPVCTQSDEDCWRQNRRGETTLRAPAAVQIPLPK
ncbi:MAG TPA: OmpA family protein [Elusimicrobiota bacterium]|jgi:peptidoglycan-associated lipoprotein|nr:OmpA family protein [Elusimicrobiota bacterium]HMU95665.1 OmpA family protein [Elusimicrobiota bacterium]HMZ25847.1 OmpA family protein [Elusimicrobiota bacterium]HNA59747.1 OmpA family protein [Elusimicrobiota bacterium]HNC74504.1 OmpA family protein [Elusimicrobiota bacterium]